MFLNKALLIFECIESDRQQQWVGLQRIFNRVAEEMGKRSSDTLLYNKLGMRCVELMHFQP
jgi:hypothetical protein